MHVVLVSSPGPGIEVHWSHAVAGELATALRARGDGVRWLAMARPGQQLAPPATIVSPTFVVMPALRALPRVAAESQLLALETVLTRALREVGSAVVVHVGIGARGSPNVAWLAERMGATAYAVARAAEVVCHRGDLVDRDHRACVDFLDPARCRRCCAGWWRRPHVVDFQNRSDLLAASLQACRSVFVPATADVDRLVAFGVSPRAVVVAADPAAITARIAF